MLCVTEFNGIVFGLNLDLMFSFSGSRVPFPDSVFS